MVNDSLKLVNSQEDLDDLFARTNFNGAKNPKWDGMKMYEDGYIYVHEYSYFGGTLINLAGDYEDSGNDCMFIQELVRLYKEGRLKVQ